MSKLTPLEEAGAKLDKLKATCSDACVDEAIHAPHRAELEAAYAEFARLGREAVGPAPIATRANHEVRRA